MRSSSLARVLPWALSPTLLACPDDASSDDAQLPSYTDDGGGDTLSPPTTSGVDSSGAGDATAGTTAGTGAEDCVDPLQVQCFGSRGFVSTDQLEGLLGRDDIVVLDTRSEPLFTTDHIPGAVRLDPATLRAMVDGVAGQVASEADSRAAFEAAGASAEVAVVAYGSENGTEPARVLWTLAYYGHQGPLWMLDGGYDQWVLEGRETETETTPPEPSSYATAVTDELRVDQQWVLDHLDDPTVLLVDARSPGEYDSAHIPGAISVDWTLNLGDDGLLLPADELRALYGEPDDDQTLVTYCQTGSRASVSWLVLTWLGYADVRLYDGSWAQWGSDPSNPIE